MSQDLKAGDFLVFQLEAGYGLLRVLGSEGEGAERVWHLAAYNDLFPDIEMLEQAASTPERLSVSHPHLALTERAFESTQVARISNAPLTDLENNYITEWRATAGREVSDRSVRLLLGLR